MGAAPSGSGRHLPPLAAAAHAEPLTMTTIAGPGPDVTAMLEETVTDPVTGEVTRSGVATAATSSTARSGVLGNGSTATGTAFGDGSTSTAEADNGSAANSSVTGRFSTGRAFAGEGGTPRPDAVPTVDDGECRYAVLSRLHDRMLALAAFEPPLLLVVDDCQWAGASFLAFVARRLEARPVGTVRVVHGPCLTWSACPWPVCGSSASRCWCGPGR